LTGEKLDSKSSIRGGQDVGERRFGVSLVIGATCGGVHCLTRDRALIVEVT
jgi:hypothetical protein